MLLDEGAAIVRISRNVTCCIGFDFSGEEFVILLKFREFVLEFINLVVWERVDLGLIANKERCLSYSQSSTHVRAVVSPLNSP